MYGADTIQSVTVCNGVSLSLVSPSAWSSLLLQHGIYFFLQPFLIVGRVHTSRCLETVGNKQQDNTPTAD